MDFGRIAKSRWVLVIGALIWVPGVLGAFAFWRRTVGDMSAGWQGALIGAGFGIIGLWLFSVINHYWDTVRTYVRASAGPLILVALAVILLGGMIYYLAFIHEPTKTVWSHPSISAAEQDRTKAECRMAAYNAIGGGRGGMKDPTPAARTNYVRDCLASKGFVSKEVKR